MVFGSYTLYDLLTSFYLLIVFVPILLAPGYVAGWLTNLLGFRKLTLPWRLCLAIPVGVGMTPIVIYWLGRFSPWSIVTACFLLLFLTWVSLLLGFGGHEKPALWWRELGRVPRIAWIAGTLWCVVALCSLADLQIGHRLYFSNVAYDYAVRTGITDAISRDGVRPFNPFYGLTGPAALRYHYFWFLPCSLAAQWSGLENASRLSMNASTVWCGWALLALIPIYLRFMQGVSGNLLTLRAKCGIFLFAVTGLDLIPNIWAVLHHRTHGDLEWWNGYGQVTSWVGTLLWVPHNAASLVAGLIGIAVIWPQEGEYPFGRKVLAGLVSALALASMIGDSVYVALVIAVFLGVWTIYVFWRREARHGMPLLVAGFATLLLAGPYVASLAGQTGSARFISVSARKFGPFVGFFVRHGFGSIATNLSFTALMPFQYFMELGVFSLVPVLLLPTLLSQRKTLSTVALTLLALIPLLIVSFLKSSVVTWSNDLGWRGILPVQFVLVLWGAEILATAISSGKHWWSVSPNGAVRVVWAATLLLGMGGTIYELVLLRCYGPLTDAGRVETLFIRKGSLGDITYGLRQGYEQLNHILPVGARIQSDPHWEVYDYFLGLYSHHPAAAFNMTCGAELGGQASACTQWYSQIEGPFVHPAHYSWQDVEALGLRLHTRALVVYQVDPAWDETGWAGQMKPALETSAMRAYLVAPERQTGITSATVQTASAAVQP